MYWYISKIYNKLEKRGLVSRLFYEKPPSVDDFFESLPSSIIDYVWPCIKVDLRKTFEGTISEVVKIDGVGAGKSTYLVLSLAYALLLLKSLRDPARIYGLMPQSKIGLAIMSLRQFQAREIIYEEVCRIILTTQVFKDYYPIEERREAGVTLLKFPNNIYLMSGGGSETIPIGFSILHAVADEMGWMLLKSHKGDEADQAANIHNMLKERIETRFGSRGLLQFVTSARAAGLFVEQRCKDLQEEPGAYTTRRALWEAKPGNWAPFFAVSLNSMAELPELGLKDKAPWTAAEAIKKEVMWLPLCLRRAFLRNPRKFLRNRAGYVSIVAKAFVLRPDMIKLNATRKNPISKEGKLLEEFKPKLGMIYYSHSDLGLNRDKAVTTIGHQESALTVIDLVYIVDPGEEGIVDFSRIRAIFYDAASRGFKFGYVTFDQFASIDTIQELRKKGYSVGIHSVDRTPDSYNAWLESHYDELIDVPLIAGYTDEVSTLVLKPDGRITHREDGSKDILDSVSGTVYHCRTLGLGSAVSIVSKGLEKRANIVHVDERVGRRDEDVEVRGAPEPSVLNRSRLQGGTRRFFRYAARRLGIR